MNESVHIVHAKYSVANFWYSYGRRAELAFSEYEITEDQLTEIIDEVQLDIIDVTGSASDIVNVYFDAGDDD